MNKIKKFLFSATFGLLTPLVATHANWTVGMSEITTFDLPNASIYDIIVGLLLWLLMIFTVLAVLAFVVAGIMFLMAGANADAEEKAKKMVSYSIMGIIIGLSGYIIIALIDGALIGYIW